ncbi:hypothetical protein KKE45_02135 [Patescibacteria group bacterium]|nr:hypothetical protein [Patescibacteria group bacterium]
MKKTERGEFFTRMVTDSTTRRLANLIATQKVGSDRMSYSCPFFPSRELDEHEKIGVGLWRNVQFLDITQGGGMEHETTEEGHLVTCTSLVIQGYPNFFCRPCQHCSMNISNPGKKGILVRSLELTREEG